MGILIIPSRYLTAKGAIAIKKVGHAQLFSASAAWALAVRDQWVGWQEKHRKKLLHLLLSNDRFLIFPWVDVRIPVEPGH